MRNSARFRIAICDVFVKSVIDSTIQIQRQKDREDASSERRRNFALYLNRSAVPAYNLRAHPKPQARSGIALGAHKWIKEPRPDFGLNPGSGVRDSQSNALARPVPKFPGIAYADLYSPVSLNGFHGIPYQIQDHVPQFSGLRKDGTILAEVFLYRNSG